MQPMSDIPTASARPAHQWLVWLIEGCAQVPRWQGTTLRFFDARTLASCIRCGRGREPLAHQIGIRYCQRCARIVLRRQLLAEYRNSSSPHES